MTNRYLSQLDYGNGAVVKYVYDDLGRVTQESYYESSSETYTYNGSQLSRMDYEGIVMYFTYGADGTPLTISYNGITYYYVTNLQGDVVAILNSSGNVVVEYTYDAWGQVLTTSGNLRTTLGWFNPLRYRGYVYDRETKLLEFKNWSRHNCTILTQNIKCYISDGGMENFPFRR